MGLLIYCNFYLRPDELRLANIFHATANIRLWSFHFRKQSSVKLNKWQFSVEINSARINNLLLYFWSFFDLRSWNLARFEAKYTRWVLASSILEKHSPASGWFDVKTCSTHLLLCFSKFYIQYADEDYLVAVLSRRSWQNQVFVWTSSWHDIR